MLAEDFTRSSGRSPQSKGQIPNWILALILFAGVGHGRDASAAGWTQFTNPNSAGGTGVSIQLSDGTIMVVGGNNQTWSKLTPDSTGSYAKGT